MPKLMLVVAIANNGAIGFNNDLPWGRSMPADLKRFANVTKKCGIVLMGRKTAESLPGPLADRRNLVLTRDPTRVPQGFEGITSLATLNHTVDPWKTVAVIGGAEVYALCAKHAQLSALTRIHCEPEADTYFPISALDTFERIGEVEHHEADEKNAYAYSFITVANKNPEPIE